MGKEIHHSGEEAQSPQVGVLSHCAGSRDFEHPANPFLHDMLAGEMPDTELPGWLDKTEVSSIGVLTLDDGARMTAEIVNLDEDLREVVVDVISSNRSPGSEAQPRRRIPVERVVTFEPQSRAEQPWPYCDPCRESPFSLRRFVLVTTMFLSMMLGGTTLLLLRMNRPYGLQEASAIVYTLFILFYTFTMIRRSRPFMFTCPAVRLQIPRLLWRHLGFLVALVVLQTAALAARPNLPEWWNIENRKGQTPFGSILTLLCLGLGFAQILTNRSLLDRAHREFSA